jgi:RimJ/RimL family protein N-acetyltransferase
MQMQPTLVGTLVRLVPLRPDNFSELYECARDPLIWEQHPEPARYTRPVFERYFQTIIDSGGALTILDNLSGRIIGASTFYGHDAVNREVKIGYTFLERVFWSKGYNPEVKTLMLDHAFRFVDRVLFEVGAGNMRSQKALRNIGATPLYETTVQGLNGAPMPCVVFGITNAQSLRSTPRPSTC